tara:strand:+ start:56 stop:613 length:558 start_codon:yes stop_codon:yes gene_type:complete
MIGIENFPNIIPASAEYPFGDIKDTPSGTPVNRYTNGDIQQFLRQLATRGGVTPNGLRDNDVNGYQLQRALLQNLPNKFVTEFTTEFDGTATIITRASIVAGMTNVNPFDQTFVGGTTSANKLLDFTITVMVQFSQTGNWVHATTGGANAVANYAIEIDNGTGDITLTDTLAPFNLSNVRVVLIG